MLLTLGRGARTEAEGLLASPQIVIHASVNYQVRHGGPMRFLLITFIITGIGWGCSGTKTEAVRAQLGEACTRGQGLGPSTSGNCEPGLVCSPVKKICVNDQGLRDELR